MTQPPLTVQLHQTIEAANDVVTQIKAGGRPDSAGRHLTMTSHERFALLAELDLLTARELSLRIALAIESLGDTLYHSLQRRG